MLGVPFYGRGWTVSSPDPQRPVRQPARRRRAGNVRGRLRGLHRIKAKLSSQANAFKIYRDEKAGFAWMYDGTTWWTYDDATEMKRKARYINDRSLGGAMIWSLDGDTANGELISALHRNLR